MFAAGAGVRIHLVSHSTLMLFLVDISQDLSEIPIGYAWEVELGPLGIASHGGQSLTLVMHALFQARPHA